MGAPLLIPFAAELTAAILGGAAYSAVNNYISGTQKPSTPSTPTTPDIPIKKDTPPSKTALKSKLGNYATGVGGILAGAAAIVGSSVTSATSQAENIATAQSQKTSELLAPSAPSPLLTNQVFIKDSIDKLIDAINANTILSATVFGTLDVNLASIGSSLTSISSTLIDISSNYDASLSNTGDVPYINQDDYYKMLAQSGMSGDEINSAIQQENLYIQGLKNSGITDYTDIKKYVQDWRSKTVPLEYQAKVGDEVAGLTNNGWHSEYTTQTKTNSVGETVLETVPKSTPATSANVELSMPKTEAWAETALGVFTAMSPDLVARELYARTLKNEFVTTQTELRDLDGNLVANIKPMEATAIKSATEARLRTDMNNINENDMDLDENFPDFDLSALFNFEKKSERLSAFITGGGRFNGNRTDRRKFSNRVF